MTVYQSERTSPHIARSYLSGLCILLEAVSLSYNLDLNPGSDPQDECERHQAEIHNDANSCSNAGNDTFTLDRREKLEEAN